MPRLIFMCAVLSSTLVGDGWASDFIGAEQCQSCHPAAYAQWRSTPHARAAEVLSEAERRDPRCTGCHATSAADGLWGVQCESCHGAGRYYWRDFIMRDTGLARAAGLQSGAEPSVCRACHTAEAPRLVPFDLTAALEQVRHATPALPATPPTTGAPR